jgi:hypothetical protein
MRERGIPNELGIDGLGAHVMTAAITISERAARRIGEILKTEGDGAMLRISVEGGGCSGFQYKFDVERAKAEDDLVIARDRAPWCWSIRPRCRSWRAPRSISSTT